MNFVAESAGALFDRRRQEGWGIDPARTLSHMTSSQTLMLNFLGPLGSDPEWLRAVLERALNRDDIDAIDNWSIEFAIDKRSTALNDMTRLDAYFEIRSRGAHEGVVLEVKYADRFNSRYVEIRANERYWALANRAGIWQQPEVTFADRHLNQLIRAHALGFVSLERSRVIPRKVSMLVAAHPHDKGASEQVLRYRATLSDPSAIRLIGLDTLFQAMFDLSPSTTLAKLAVLLRDRYINEALSDDYWSAFTTTPRRHAGGPS